MAASATIDDGAVAPTRSLWPEAPILVGNGDTFNPKMNNVRKGLEVACRKVVALCDAGILIDADELCRAAAPLVAAGLQAYFTHLVLATAETHGEAVFGRTDPATGCPCCGSRPTASVTRIGADESGHRYLACSLCATQWHYVRIKCAHCESTRGITYQQLEGAPTDGARGAYLGAVKAECCDSCGHYLKLVAMERDPEVEPMADDLASVALDLLVSEAGHQRAGVNLMLVFGEAESP